MMTIQGKIKQALSKLFLKKKLGEINTNLFRIYDGMKHQKLLVAITTCTNVHLYFLNHIYNPEKFIRQLNLFLMTREELLYENRLLSTMYYDKYSRAIVYSLSRYYKISIDEERVYMDKYKDAVHDFLMMYHEEDVELCHTHQRSLFMKYRFIFTDNNKNPIEVNDSQAIFLTMNAFIFRLILIYHAYDINIKDKHVYIDVGYYDALKEHFTHAEYPTDKKQPLNVFLHAFPRLAIEQ